jgi:hypothetical protein
MRIAVTSDIHGNLLALDAVLADIALDYDWDRTARRVLDNGRPEWARMYLTGSTLEPHDFI